MTPDSLHRLRRLERLALVPAAIALLAAIVLGWRAPEGLVPAWRLAVFACLQPALGSLIFVLIFRLTGGHWMQGLAPFLLAGVRLLPWIWLLALPLLWFPVAARPADRTAATAGPRPEARPGIAAQLQPAPAALEEAFASADSRHLDGKLRAYFGRPMLGARAVFYAIVFFLLAAGATRVMRDGGPATMRWFGPVGLIGLVFMLHLLATDWFVLLEPGWHSTGFPLVWITGQALAGLAAATSAALWFGADPAAADAAGRARGLDWGNLLLASVMAWTYVAFVQWLIIWSGNLPAETAWYRHRSHGLWGAVIVGLGVLEFGAPFLLLLSRGLKRRRPALASVATLLLAGQLAYTVWLIAPALPRAGAAAPWLTACVFVAAVALSLNRYLAGARRTAGLSAA